MELQENAISYPSILFKVKDGFFSLDSKNVASIMQMPVAESLPDSPACVTGIFKFRDRVIPMVSARKLFDMPTLEAELEEFSSMLEHRKQDHINWVKELNRCIRDNEKFTLATDPHKCAFGRWYDTFETNNSTMRFHLNKIEEPHRLLHETAEEVEHCKRECETCHRDECLRKKLNRLQEEYMPRILSLLDDAKDLFKNAHRNMLIVIELEDCTFSLIVDDVLSVEELIDISGEEPRDNLQGSPYISGIKKSRNISNLILVVNHLKIADTTQKDFR